MDARDFLFRYLATEETPIFIKNKFYRILNNRFFYLSLWKSRIFTIEEVFRSFLPSRFHASGTDEKALMVIKERLNEIFEKNKIYQAGKTELFGKNLYPAAENINLESWVHTFLMIFQSIIADQYHAREFLKENSVVIDAGANIGIFSVLAANLSPRGEIFSFEPTPRTYKTLKRNTEGYNNIKIFNTALGDREGDADLVISESSGSNSLSDSGLASVSGEKVRVPIITIDDFVIKNKINRVDFIKMDTEGYEGRILKGAVKTIEKFSPTISMSAYHHKDDKKTIPELMMSLNPKYRYRLTKNVEDNLLFYTVE